MSNPSNPIGRVLEMLLSGATPSEITVKSTSETDPVSERKLLRRCAVARRFDKELAGILAELPTPLPDNVLFDRLTSNPLVERDPNRKDFYRIDPEAIELLIMEWDEGRNLLSPLRRRLAAYHREPSHPDPIEELYQLARFDTAGAESRFEELFSEAEEGPDLARCAELIGIFSDLSPIPESLRKSIEARRARLNARSFWQDEFYQTGSYLEREKLNADLGRLMAGDGLAGRTYQIHAPGGTGKTMFVRWSISRWCVERRIPCARIDFDFANSGELASRPEALALAIAAQWNGQIPGEPLVNLIGRLSGPSQSGSSSPLAELANVLTLPDGVNALVVLDTLEEVLIPHRPRLLEILRHLKVLCEESPGRRVRVMLAGRYDLAEKLEPEEFAVLGTEPIQAEISPFDERESRVYLTEIRGLSGADRYQADRVAAAIERSRGNPLKLRLFSEILIGEPSLSGDDIRANLSVEVEYLIRRVVLRIGENERDPETGQIGELQKQLRWVLRYGVVPRKLTLEFLQSGPIRERIEREATGEKSEDRPEKGLENLRSDAPAFPRAATVPIFQDLWEELRKYAGGSSWVRVASEAGEADALVFTPDVLNPMRALLMEQEHNLFATLHLEALEYFRAEAEDARKHGRGDRVRWLREVVYHDFQRRGEAAGPAWRDLISSEEFRDDPAGREILADDVTGRAYVMDDDPPRPHMRKDGSWTISPEILSLAYYHKARALADLARLGPGNTRRRWNDASNAFKRHEKAADLLTDPVAEPDPQAVSLLEAVIQANADGGDGDFALATLQSLRYAKNSEITIEALRELAHLLVFRNDPDAEGVLRELIDRTPEGVDRPTDLRNREALARRQLAFDQLADALVTSVDAYERSHQLGPGSEEFEARFDLLSREILLRSGQPEEVFSPRQILVGGLTTPRVVPLAWEPATGFLKAEARLSQLDPKRALDAHREARKSGRNDLRKKSGYLDLLPRKPEEREQRARISLALMDLDRSLQELSTSGVEWLRLAKPANREGARRVLAAQASITLHQIGDLNGAGSLLALSLPADEEDPGKSESSLRIALLRAGLAARLGDLEKARALFDEMVTRTQLSPPRFRVLAALSALEFAESLAPRPYFEVLIGSLAEVNPHHARLAMLGGLDRCPPFVDLPPHLVSRFLGTLPDLDDVILAPRDRAILGLLGVEALRVVGGVDQAVAVLDRAREGLLGGEVAKSREERNIYPLLALLRAEDRLGRPIDACRRGSELLPSFSASFYGPSELLLVAMVWVEQAERALLASHEEADKAADEAIAESRRRLENSQFPGARSLMARLLHVRAKVALRRGFADDAARSRENARDLERSLGIPTASSSVSSDKFSLKETDEAVLVPPPPLLPTHPALAIDVGWKVGDGLSVATRPPSAPGRNVVHGFRFLEERGLGRDPTPVDAVASVPMWPLTAFVREWQQLAVEMTSLLMPPNTLAELDTFASRGDNPVDLRISIDDPNLCQFPWEFLRRPDGDRAFLSQTSGIRHLHRSTGPGETDRTTIRWLQAVLGQMFDRGLLVDGQDGARLRNALRSFQSQQGLETTGTADATTRWALDRAWRLSRNQPPRSVLLIAADSQDSYSTLVPFKEAIRRIYRLAGYEVTVVSSRGPDLSEVRELLRDKPLSYIQIRAPLAAVSSIGICFSLSLPDQPSTKLNTLTSRDIDEFLKGLPESDLKPVVILNPPLPSSPFEAALQLFLKNAFASELFCLGNAPVILATGLEGLDLPSDFLEDLIRNAAQGMSVGDILGMIRRSSSTGENRPRDIGAPLFSIGTALFTRDPDSRVPGAESGVSNVSGVNLEVAWEVKAAARPEFVSRTVYALLVGIDEYPHPNPKLRGCVNDIDVFADYLGERGGESQGVAIEIRKLTNAEATRDAVIRGFREHLARAGSGDVALFYFSGQGSQEQSPEEFWKIEPDHLDETLVCVDSRTPGSWDLADKEIAKLIGELAAKGPHVAVILDCCHSGSGTRAIESVVRRAPTDLRRRPIESFLVSLQEVEVASRDVGAGRYASPEGRHVLFAACRPDEEAKEFFGDGKYRGAFSYFLVEALKAAGGVPTYRNLLDRVRSLVSSQVTNQSPQLEATRPDDLDAIFLDGTILPSSAQFVASWKAGRWTLNGGSAHGLPSPHGSDAARFALFQFDAGPEELRDPSRALATAAVVEVSLAFSRIEVEGGVTLDRSRVFKASIISLPMPQIAVSLQGDDEALGLIRKALATSSPEGMASPFIREAGPGEPAEFCLVAQAGSFEITRPDNTRPIVAPIDDKDPASAQLTVARLEHIARWTLTARLSNPASSIQPSDVKITVLFDSKEVAGREIRLEYRDLNGRLVGPQFQISITNNSHRRLYCCLLDLTQGYKVFAGLFRAGCIQLDPGQTVWASDGKPISANIPDADWSQGIIEYKDLLKLIVCTQEFDASLLEQPSLLDLATRSMRPSNRSMRQSIGLLGSLNGILKKVQTRELNASPTVSTLDDWQTSELTFTTVRPLDKASVPGPGQSEALTNGVLLNGHPKLRADARLSTEALASRDLGSVNLPRLLVEDPAVCVPFSAPGTFGGPGLSVLELTGVEDSRHVTHESPLRLTFPLALKRNEHVIAVAFDGEFFLPIGRDEVRSQTSTTVAIDRLPPTLADGRSLGGAIKIFLEKVVDRAELPAPTRSIFSVAVASNGVVTTIGNHAEVSDRVAKSARVLLLIPGFIGDVRDMASAVQFARLADGTTLASRYDAVLTFDVEGGDAGIEQNAKNLRECLELVGLGVGHGKQLDIVAHSTGGLIARWFIEREGGPAVASRLVMLGTPNAGLTWPGPRDWSTLALAFGFNQFTKIAWPAPVIAQLAALGPNSSAVLRDSLAGSPILAELAKGGEPDIPYAVLAGQSSILPMAFNSSGPFNVSLLDRLINSLISPGQARESARSFFSAGDNDLVVAISSVRPAGPLYEVYPVACDHMSYLRDPAVLESLADALVARP
ncbi:caspase family protein [Isosphaeraceae bacterium EP7]